MPWYSAFSDTSLRTPCALMSARSRMSAAVFSLLSLTLRTEDEGCVLRTVQLRPPARCVHRGPAPSCPTLGPDTPARGRRRVLRRGRLRCQYPALEWPSGGPPIGLHRACPLRRDCRRPTLTPLPRCWGH